jgi:hypothetical protein
MPLQVKKSNTISKSKKAIYRLFLVILPFIVISIMSCRGNEPVFCTMEFRMITVSVKNDSVIRAFVVDSKQKDTLASETIWSDASRNDLKVADDGEIFNRLKNGEKRDYKFTAISSQGKPITSTFVISRDNCHIIKISGPTELSF